MRKLLLTLMVAAGFATTSNAQLAEGSVFPDFTLTSITGQSIHLYSLLDSGYTVFIDISATWCNPCWNYHIGHHLDSLYEQHGPTGWSGVNSTTTNNVVVLFVQGESTSNLAELYDGPGSTVGSASVETPHSTSSQGNWVAGTPYPIIDDTTSADPTVGTAALDAAWSIAYFPTVYMICRDHLVHVMQQPTAVDAYAAALATCPSYAPSSTVDAKAVPYTGNDYFVCNATPSVSFQNYSKTTSITSASIVVTDAAGATVATQPWTGSLAPYAVTNVPVTSFAGTSFGGYKYSVNVTGDSYPANNASVDSVFKVYTASNAVGLPALENFSGNISYKEDFLGGYVYPVSSTSPVITGPNGNADTALLFEFYFQSSGGTDEFVYGNFNTAGVTGLTLSFDVSYAQYDATTADALAVQVTSDCGATWAAPWSESGATLSTAPMDNSGEFSPSAAGQWKHVTVDMHTYASPNMTVKFVGTSQYGNDAWVDNIRLSNTTGVATVSALSGISIVPNPAKDFAIVNISLADETEVTVQVYDAVGRLVNSVVKQLAAGNQQIDLPTTGMSTGLYNVKISAGTSVVTKQLSVIQ